MTYNNNKNFQLKKGTPKGKAYVKLAMVIKRQNCISYVEYGIPTISPPTIFQSKIKV